MRKFSEKKIVGTLLLGLFIFLFITNFFFFMTLIGLLFFAGIIVTIIGVFSFIRKVKNLEKNHKKGNYNDKFTSTFYFNMNNMNNVNKKNYKDYEEVEKDRLDNK